MTFRRIMIATAITALLALALYLLVVYQLLRQQHPAETAPAGAPETQTATIKRSTPSPESSGETNLTILTPDSDKELLGGRKTLEIFGRVLDDENDPLADVVIAEERYFFKTRSDAEGNYRLPLELPRHRYPVLHFLRYGYDSKRIKLGKKELDQNSDYELDVQLDNSLDSVNLQGWVANELGLGIEGAQVQLSATYSRNTDSFYLTDFTDANGNFGFEGVRAQQTYKLTVNLTPEYPHYENNDLVVTQNPGPINIVLGSLRFVDIDGMIVDRDEIPVPGYEIYITSLSTGAHGKKIVSDSSGFFSLKDFPLGEVSLATRGAEYFKIDGLRLDESRYQNLVLTVDRGNHYLSGWVSDVNGIAIGRAMVTLDRKFSRGGVRHTSYRSQATNLNGRFAFENLGRGEHRITVYAWGFDKQEMSHRFDSQSDDLRIMLRRSE